MPNRPFPVPDVSLEFKEQNCYKNSINLKSGNVRIPFTHEQVMEVAKCKQDIQYFIKNYVKIVSLDEGLVSFDAFDYQKEIIQLCKDNRWTMVMAARQLGKCSCFQTLTRIRNKKTGKVYTIQIGDFFNLIKNNDTI